MTGSHEQRIVARSLLTLILLGSAGCHFPGHSRTPTADLARLENPLFIQTSNREFLWDQIVDTVDDYFEIRQEERVRIVQGIPMQGRIETLPKIGSTILEPWRGDSTRGSERLHGTLQTVRRQAKVNVILEEFGLLVDVQVYKELEDLAQPENSTVGMATQRYDNSLVRRRHSPVGQAKHLGWIPLGRDVSLEQEMLAQIRARMHDPSAIRQLPVVQE